jgi:hypothetical protein
MIVNNQNVLDSTESSDFFLAGGLIRGNSVNTSLYKVRRCVLLNGSFNCGLNSSHEMKDK